jgi:methionyl-tRNA formyltransferase
MKKMRIVFFGTPDFSVPSLEILANHPLVEIVNIISMPDRKSGRGHQLKSPEVIQFAKDKKLPYFQTENINKEEVFLKELATKNIDCFIVLAFAQFLNDKLLAIPTLGAFNIHTSLLPKYRGAAPIQYALLAGDKSTGVSIQKMVKKMDAGDLVFDRHVDIHSLETGGLLYTRLKFNAALALNDFIQNLSNNKITYTPQDESGVSFAPTLKREDGHLNFEQEFAETIINKTRGLFPWPGTYCYLGTKRLKVFSIELFNKKIAPGTVDISLGEILIGTKDLTIRLIQIQLEGKKPCLGKELLNGIKEEIVINPK